MTPTPLDPRDPGSIAAAPPPPRAGTLLIPRLAGVYRAAEPVGYAALRVWFGWTILTHGYPKLFRVAHGATADPFANTIRLIRDEIGLPFPEALAILATAVESVGAVMLAVGLATRFVAPMLAVQMLVIAFGVLWPVWAWGERGMEYALLMAALAAYMTLRGGDRWSLDRLIGREL